MAPRAVALIRRGLPFRGEREEFPLSLGAVGLLCLTPQDAYDRSKLFYVVHGESPRSGGDINMSCKLHQYATTISAIATAGAPLRPMERLGYKNSAPGTLSCSTFGSLRG